jgi:hypothetical protein
MARERAGMSGEAEDGAEAGGSPAGSAVPLDEDRTPPDLPPPPPPPDLNRENRLKEMKDRIDQQIENQFRDQGAP